MGRLVTKPSRSKQKVLASHSSHAWTSILCSPSLGIACFVAAHHHRLQCIQGRRQRADPQHGAGAGASWHSSERCGAWQHRHRCPCVSSKRPGCNGQVGHRISLHASCVLTGQLPHQTVFGKHSATHYASCAMLDLAIGITQCLYAFTKASLC